MATRCARCKKVASKFAECELCKKKHCLVCCDLHRPGPAILQSDSSVNFEVIPNKLEDAEELVKTFFEQFKAFDHRLGRVKVIAIWHDELTAIEDSCKDIGEVVIDPHGRVEEE